MQAKEVKVIANGVKHFGFDSWVAMYIAFKKAEVPSAHNGFVVIEGSEVWVYSQDYLTERALVEVLERIASND